MTQVVSSGAKHALSAKPPGAELRPSLSPVRPRPTRDPRSFAGADLVTQVGSPLAGPRGATTAGAVLREVRLPHLEVLRDL